MRELISETLKVLTDEAQPESAYCRTVEALFAALKRPLVMAEEREEEKKDICRFVATLLLWDFGKSIDRYLLINYLKRTVLKVAALEGYSGLIGDLFEVIQQRLSTWQEEEGRYTLLSFLGTFLTTDGLQLSQKYLLSKIWDIFYTNFNPYTDSRGSSEVVTRSSAILVPAIDAPATELLHFARWAFQIMDSNRANGPIIEASLTLILAVIDYSCKKQLSVVIDEIQIYLKNVP
jgi:hypothetical protein